MKTYRVALNIGGFVFVDADRYETVDGKVRFFHGESVCAEYAKPTVKDITERQNTQRIGIFSQPAKRAVMLVVRRPGNITTTSPPSSE